MVKGGVLSITGGRVNLMEIITTDSAAARGHMYGYEEWHRYVPSYIPQELVEV